MRDTDQNVDSASNCIHGFNGKNTINVIGDEENMIYINVFF